MDMKVIKYELELIKETGTFIYHTGTVLRGYDAILKDINAFINFLENKYGREVIVDLMDKDMKDVINNIFIEPLGYDSLKLRDIKDHISSPYTDQVFKIINDLKKDISGEEINNDISSLQSANNTPDLEGLVAEVFNKYFNSLVQRTIPNSLKERSFPNKKQNGEYPSTLYSLDNKVEYNNFITIVNTLLQDYRVYLEKHLHEIMTSGFNGIFNTFMKYYTYDTLFIAMSYICEVLNEYDSLKRAIDRSCNSIGFYRNAIHITAHTRPSANVDNMKLKTILNEDTIEFIRRNIILNWNVLEAAKLRRIIKAISEQKGENWFNIEEAISKYGNERLKKFFLKEKVKV